MTNVLSLKQDVINAKSKVILGQFHVCNMGQSEGNCFKH